MTGKSDYKFSDAQRLEKKNITGVFVRLQNSSDNKYSVDGNKLITNADLNQAYLMLKLNGADTIYEYPLEHFGYDSTIHNPGSYAPVHLPEGIDIVSSYVRFSNTAPTAGRDIEIVFLTPDWC